MASGAKLYQQSTQIYPETITHEIADIQRGKLLDTILTEHETATINEVTARGNADRAIGGFPEFSPSEHYASGDVVFYTDRLYIFKQSHTGDWNASHVAEFSIKVLWDGIVQTLSNKADIYGFYETMAVGIAKNLEGRKSVEDSFFERTTGGEAEVANGVAQLEEIQGNTGSVNQLAITTNYTVSNVTGTKNEDGSVSIVGTASADGLLIISAVIKMTPSHKYCLCGNKSGYSMRLTGYAAQIDGGGGVIVTTTASDTGNRNIVFVLTSGVTYNVTIFPKFFDLTLMYGSGYEPTTVTEFEQRLKDDLNLSLNDYIAYTKGKLVNVTFEGIESTGRNLLDPTTNKARILGVYSDDYDAYYGITGTYGTLTFVSDKGETSTITPDSEGKFLLEESGYLTVANPSNCCVFLWWDGSKTDHVDYDKEVAYLDVKNIWGKAQGSDTLVQVFPYGMGGQEGWRDILKVIDGATVAVKNGERIDMSTLPINSGSVSNVYPFGYFSTRFPDKKGGVTNIISPKYLTTGTFKKDKNIFCSSTNSTGYIIDSSFVTPTPDPTTTQTYTFDVQGLKNSLQGHYVEYQLENSIIYTDLVYKNSPYFADGTPVILPMNYKVDNWGIERILPQNTSEDVVTAKPIISCKYSIDAVEDLDTLHTQIDNLDEKKPNKEGTYPNMVVGAAKALEGSSSVPAEYTFRKVDDSVSSGLAMLKQIKGKSLVWNQLISGVVDTASGLTFTYSENNIIHINGTATVEYANCFTTLYGVRSRALEDCPLGVYFLSVEIIKNTDNLPIKVSAFNGRIIFANYPSDITKSYSVLGVCSDLTTGASFGIKDYGGVGTVFNDVQISVNLMYLTLMFGKGKEPATVAEFEALYNFPCDYNTGEIINNKTTAIESVGFNQWDEQWELGLLNPNGTVTSGTRVCSKNYIPIMPNVTYLMRYTGGNGKGRGAFYDANYNVVQYFYDFPEAIQTVGGVKSGTFVPPAGAKYLKFCTNTAYQNSYNNDICINISDATKNGTYEPYEKFTLDLNLPTATGKLNGEGESVVIFPDGMRGAGSAYDSLIVDEDGYARRAIVRMTKVLLTDLSWGGTTRFQSTITTMKSTVSGGTEDYYARKSGIMSSKYIVPSDVNTQVDVMTDMAMLRSGQNLFIKDTSCANVTDFMASIAGVELIYELAEPLEYVLDTPIYIGYQVRAGGTEKRLPEDTASEVTAPFACDVVYPLDAVGFINDADEKFCSVASLQGMLAAQQAAGIFASYTMTWSAEQNKYIFTFVK